MRFSTAPHACAIFPRWWSKSGNSSTAGTPSEVYAKRNAARRTRWARAAWKLFRIVHDQNTYGWHDQSYVCCAVHVRHSSHSNELFHHTCMSLGAIRTFYIIAQYTKRVLRLHSSSHEKRQWWEKSASTWNSGTSDVLPLLWSPTVFRLILQKKRAFLLWSMCFSKGRTQPEYLSAFIALARGAVRLWCTRYTRNGVSLVLQQYATR